MKPEVYKQLAASGKYYNTGKVLIGLQHEPRTTPMTPEGEFIQGVLLGDRRGLACPKVRYWSIYVAVLVAIFALLTGMGIK